MKLHSLLLLIILAAIAAFSALNWSTFISPTNLSLGFTSVHMPLGLVMLGMLVLIVMLCLMFVVYIQAKALLESHQHAKALKAQRELADQAELSRFTELRNYLEGQLRAQEAKSSELKTEILARIEQQENHLRTAIEEAGNTLAAYIGEMDDRLGKKPGGGS